MINSIINLYLSNPIGQTIGLIAFIIQCLGFINKDDRKLVIFQTLAGFFWIVHFRFMGIFVGIALGIINIFRNYFILKFTRNIGFYALFFVVQVISGIIFFDNIYSIFALSGSLVGLTVMFFLLGTGLKLRLTFLIASSLWLIYHILNGSIGGVINEIVMISLNLTTIFRLYMDKKKAYLEVDTKNTKK